MAPILRSLIFFLVFSISMAANARVVSELVFIDDMGANLDTVKISKLISTKLGEQIETRSLIEDTQTLAENLPQYENMETRVDPAGEDSLKVTFEFQKRRMIRLVRIKINGNGEGPIGLQDKLSLVRGTVFKSSQLKDDQEVLREEFIRLGFPKVEIEVEIKEARKKRNEVEIHYTVVLKTEKLIVRRVKVHGNSKVSDKDLLDAIKTKTRCCFWQSRPIFDASHFPKDEAAITDFYRELGFIDAKVTSSFRISKDKNASIRFTVVEGPQYLVKKINVHGVRIGEPEIIRSVFDYKQKGYGEKALRRSLQKVRDYYGNYGYVMAEVILSYDSGSEEVNIFVKEGKRQYIRKVVVVGNEKMKTEVILRDVRLEAGQLVNTLELDKALRRLKETGYYSLVQVDYKPTSLVSGEVIIMIKEASNQFITFGVGASTSSNVIGELSYGNNNLFGTGKSISLKMKASEELKRLGLVYRDPHVFGSDLEFSASAMAEERDQNQYEERKLAIILMIEKRITDNLKVGLGTRLEFIDIDDVAKELSDEVHDASGKDTIIGLVSTLVYKTETYDASGDAKSGYKVRLALYPSFANDGAFVKTFTEVIAHHSLGSNSYGASHTISGRMTLGYASDKSPYHEKYYGGGIGTIRGFEARSITPEGTNGGGNVIVSAGATYSFPIYKNRLKGILFLEAAAVGTGFSDLSNVRVVGGFGLRANLNDTFLGSSIEAGIALPLLKQKGDSLKPFYFMFGNYDPAYDL